MSRRHKENFDPDHIDVDDMYALGENIETYVETLLRMMVIPEKAKKYTKRTNESIKLVRELVKKLKKGKKSVFKDLDNWNSI